MVAMPILYATESVGKDLRANVAGNLEAGHHRLSRAAQIAKFDLQYLSVAPDAVSFWELTGDGPGTVLPPWYMPAPMRAPKLTGWRRHLVRGNVVLIVASFVAINCAGLCNTYGQLHF